MGDRKAKMKIEKDTLILSIEGVPRKEAGMIITPLPENHQYKKATAHK